MIIGGGMIMTAWPGERRFFVCSSFIFMPTLAGLSLAGHTTRLNKSSINKSYILGHTTT